MNQRYSHYLVLLDTQVVHPFFDYSPLNLWLDEREARRIAVVGATAHAVLIRSRDAQDEIEQSIRSLLAKPDDRRVIRIQDFDWPSAVPDSESLKQWLDLRQDWKEWTAKHG